MKTELLEGYGLYTDPITENHYLQIPISSLSDLQYLQHTLLENLTLLTRHEEDHHKETRHCIYWICKILQAGYPNLDLEVIAEF